jgi:hypothetical protein
MLLMTGNWYIMLRKYVEMRNNTQNDIEEDVGRLQCATSISSYFAVFEKKSFIFYFYASTEIILF